MIMRIQYIVVIFRFILFIVSFAQGYGNNGCGVTGDWSLYEGQCYRCINAAVSWQNARSSCSQLGARLVTISNEGINTFLHNLCPNDNYWIGLNDISNVGSFVWDGTSTPFSYSNWYPDEPNNAGDEYEACVHIWADSHKWNDMICGMHFSYICQKPQDIDECLSSPCVHGTCTDQLNSYKCECTPGYTGAICDIDIDECLSSPCVHGTCTNQLNSYKCQCQPGYTGTNCDIDINECLSSPCVHGTCANQLNSYTCQCQTGYTGTNCEKDVDECQSSPCVHGVCSNLLNAYSCQCYPGYEGVQCQIDINECLSSPCQHGTCIDKIDSYSCNCSPGYIGRDCDTDVDECQSSPCVHGNCSDLVNEYRCQCFPGYEGLQCQIGTF